MQVPRKGMLIDSAGHVHLVWSYEDPSLTSVTVLPWLIIDPITNEARTAAPPDATRVIDLTVMEGEEIAAVHRDLRKIRVTDTPDGEWRLWKSLQWVTQPFAGHTLFKKESTKRKTN